MLSNNRDENIVRHILKYCDEVQTAHDDFSNSQEKFFKMHQRAEAAAKMISEKLK